MRVLYDLIHARSYQSWNGPIDKDNFNKWADHWLATARTIADEFAAQGLMETAKAVARIISQQGSFRFK